MPQLNMAQEEIEFAEITPPEFGDIVEIEQGLLWLRMPLPMALKHVNIYIFDEGDHWTLIDAGIWIEENIALWEHLLNGPLSEKPVRRIVVTHHHPDHIGLAGWFQKRGAALITTRVSWLIARMLILDQQERPTSEQLRFWREAGMEADEIAKRAEQRPFNMADIVHPLPLGFQSIAEGDVLKLSGKNWRAHIGQGHANDHLTLWREDKKIILAGDQCLPSISPNIGVYPTEPDANPLQEWISSCERFQGMAQPEALILPGHGRPFYNLPARMSGLLDEHHSALGRLREYLSRPKSIIECFEPLYRREIRASEFSLALAEAVAHVNYLKAAGEIQSELKGEKKLWQRRP